MPEAPAITPLGAATLNRDWRLEVDTGTATGGAVATVTATSGNAVLASTAHGLVVNQPVSVTSAVAPFTLGTVYYVSATNFAANTFSLSATPGGALVTPSAGGTLGLSKGPVWTIVRGRTDFKPGVDTTLQEDSDMDSAGWKSQTKTAAAWSLEFKVARKGLAGAGSGQTTYDPGQEALRLAGDQFGAANSVLCRWFKLGAVRTEAYQGYAAVAWSPDGGGMDGLDTVTVNLSGQGPRTSIAHPYTLP
jgi:hypothetical protein